jgi:phage baseplate assembly protein W
MSTHGASGPAPRDIVGTGLAFPLRVDARGGIALARQEQDIEEAIAIILGTAPGERPMRPEFGCGIHDHVFGGFDGYTLGKIDYEIRVSLERWEPRIELIDIEFDTGGIDHGRLDIEIIYAVRATSDVRNLVHPFYLIPEDEAE